MTITSSEVRINAQIPIHHVLCTFRWDVCIVFIDNSLSSLLLFTIEYDTRQYRYTDPYSSPKVSQRYQGCW